ncbi:hypothetical protein N9089_00770 [Crocinitomicaceae bacterium]|nr:hypothetical protein [Crocinitomicaceae bacterium]
MVDDPHKREEAIVIKSKGRRKAVKQIAGGLTALAAYHVLPAKWETPIIESIFIPAHAQTSGQLVEHEHPHTHDENHPDTHADSHSHTDPHPDSDAHKHSHDTTDPRQRQHVVDQSRTVATISNLQIVQDGSDLNWRVGFDWTVTNGPVEVSYTLTNGDTGSLIGQETSETRPDGSSYSGTVFIPFALLNPGQTLTVTATSPDPTVTISGSPLSSTAPIP